jgi:hypothetical protein
MKLKLMPDYQCFPVWIATENCYGDVDPSELPLSNQLRSDLLRWSDWYDSSIDLADGRFVGFGEGDAEARFWEEGKRLARRLRQELPVNYEVIEKFDQ